MAYARRETRNAKEREYYAIHRERILARRAEWKKKNPNWGVRYYAKNKKVIDARAQGVYRRDRTQILRKRRARRKENPELVRKLDRKYWLKKKYKIPELIETAKLIHEIKRKINAIQTANK